jgi:para-aminobenzoate synthetase component 1
MPVHSLPYPEDEGALVAALSRELPDAVWLDSGDGFGRYSIIAADPRAMITWEGGVLWHREGGAWHREPHAVDPLAWLRQQLATARDDGPPPFAGGAIGYFGYDLGERCMGVPREQSSSIPEMLVGLYDWAVVSDHYRRVCWLAGPAADGALARWLDTLTRGAPATGSYRVGEPAVDLDEAGYRQAFARVRRYIRDGDCYQVNLSRCFSADFDGDALAAYRDLRRYSSGPYGAYLGFAGAEVLSLSPERFLTLRDRHVETRPIKGTRAREADPAGDAARRAELLQSAKDRAENVMIVDLLRNDLGRVCRPGSVRVPELFAIESYATVHHLVSSVVGELAQGHDALDLLRAALPGGSITGAPKRRAMEIIAELEPSRRGVYCGSIGTLGYDGAMDTSIAIRTAVRTGDRLEYRAGGGLVWDSACEAEFAETASKARAFLDFLAG